MTETEETQMKTKKKNMETGMVEEAEDESKKKNEKSSKEVSKKDDKKENDAAFEIKDPVCVDLTDALQNYDFCHMDGVIVKRKEDGSFVVLLDDLKEEVDAEQDHLEPRRDADPREKWEKGDAVQVLETNSGIDGWWDATVVKKSGKKWQVKWRGEYEAHGDLSTVDAKKMRRRSKKIVIKKNFDFLIVSQIQKFHFVC